MNYKHLLILCCLLCSLLNTNARDPGQLQTTDGETTYYHDLRVREDHVEVVPIAASDKPYKISKDTLSPDSLKLFYPEEFGYKFIEGEFVAEKALANNPEVKVLYRIPVDSQNKPVKEAENFVFIAPYLHDNGSFFKKERVVKELTTALGCSVFTILLDSSKTDVNNKQECHYYKESGSHEITLSAWEKIKQEHNIQTNKKFFIYGTSGGSSMGQMMGVLYPDKIEAVIGHGGRFFKTIPQDSPVSFFMSNTIGDSVAGENQALAIESRKNGVQLFYAELPPVPVKKTERFFHHIKNYYHDMLLLEFVKGIIQGRGDESSFPIPEWKYDESDYAAPNSDLHIAEAKIGIRNQHLKFPSAEFAKLWTMRPQFEEVQYGKVEDENVTITYPRTTKPLGIVIFMHDHNLLWSTSLLDNLYYLADQGYIGIGLVSDNNHLGGLDRITELYQWITQQENWQSLPIYITGSRTGGQIAMSAAFNIQDPRLRAVGALNSPIIPYFSEWGAVNQPNKNNEEDLSPFAQSHKRPINIILYYSDQYDLTLNLKEKYPIFTKSKAELPPNLSINYMKSDSVCMERKWFPAIREMLKQFQ